ncbi:arginase [Polycladidibacter hongkongensis]|uniref:arginase n=1 Tax=Polycladidibacter hongkongensis TaxID=1647556 RepID=UPI00082BDB8C|nr:arginase [Pseudovibrio hongkongensis]
MAKDIILIGAPIETGTHLAGCRMGPDALRCAKLGETLEALGNLVCDWGNLRVVPEKGPVHPNKAIHDLDEIVAWTKALQKKTAEAARGGSFPIIMGGDHSLAMGSVSGLAQVAKEQNRPFYVLWLDAHPDYHMLETTRSGNLHGTPVAYYTGRAGFEGYFPPVTAPVSPKNICMMGLRSVDDAEHDFLQEDGVLAYDMRAIDEQGVSKPLQDFLENVRDTNGLLHVSFDVDFLEPDIAPAVGTTVPGGATFREAHLIMEILADSGLVSSLDLVELNPFLDERGKTASLMVDFVASLFGKRVLDRPTRPAHGPFMS